MKGGPTIQEGLHWIVRHGATGEVIFEEKNTGSIMAEIPAGVHDVEVIRMTDQARATGELVLTPRGAKLMLPLITEYPATLKAPEVAVAGETIRVSWSGPNYKSDHIAVYEPDDNNHKNIHYTYTSDGSPVRLKLPESPGVYEIRYVLNSSKQDLSRHKIEITE